MFRDRNCWVALLQVALVCAMTSWAESAAATDDESVPELTSPPMPAAEPATLDVGIGAAITTDYVSRGISQSDSDPAIQGYVEPSIGIAYLNIWSSNVDFGDTFRGAEIDVAGGIRPELGPLSFDLGYVHYFYSPEDVSPDYGEFFAKADYSVGDRYTILTRIFFAPDYNQSGTTATFIEGGVKLPLPNDFALYGGVGYQYFEDRIAFEDLTWNAGLSYNWKALTLDVHYWDTDLSDDECIVRSGFADACDARVVGTISFDFSWSELRDRRSGPVD